MDIISQVLINVFVFGLFVLLYFFLNQAETEPVTSSKKFGAIAIYVLVGIGFFLSLLIGLLFHILAFSTALDSLGLMMNMDEPTLHKVGFSVWIPSLIALLFYIPALRRGIARFIPLNPTSRVHTVTLALSMIIIIQMAVTTYAIGIDVLSETQAESSVWSLIASIWSQDLMFLLLGFVGVGLLTKRSFPETLERLGLRKPTGNQIFIAFAIAIGLVGVAYILEIILAQYSSSTDQNVQEYTEKLIGPLFTSIPGILTLGLAAAIGEETIFRGAMQPRFGILLTSLLFALVHSNYGLSISTLIVFGLGICLGLVRARFNLTTAMIIHATYNMSLGALSYLQS